MEPKCQVIGDFFFSKLADPLPTDKEMKTRGEETLQKLQNGIQATNGVIWYEDWNLVVFDISMSMCRGSLCGPAGGKIS